MGYYTQYDISFFPEGSKSKAAFLEALDSGAREEYEYALEAGCAKWYDHEKEVLEASKRVPNLLIIMDGHGETAGDVWRKFFRNGKVEVCTWTPPVRPANWEL